MKEWNWEKNNALGLFPDKLICGSNKKVWWKCSKCGYEWEAKIGNRTRLGRGCPCCANHKIVKGINDLATTNPELLKEWHPTKNTNISPCEVPAGSRKKVWWLCPNGHEYQASLLHRKHGTKCPVCNSGRQTSFAEQCVFFYVKQQFPDAINRYKAEWLENMEVDIFIPSLYTAIEYDGFAWHKHDKSLKREQKKYNLCHQHGIKLIRLREKFAPLGSDIADYQLGDNENLYESKNLKNVIKDLITNLTFFNNRIDINIERDRVKIQEAYLKAEIKNSFGILYPQIAKEWDNVKNGTLSPNMFKPHSGFKAWWICPVCKHSYQTTISHRAEGTGCPKCGIEKSRDSKSKKVVMINNSNRIVREFKSISEASRQMKINSSNISMVCNGQRSKAGGFYWKYLENTKDQN